MMIVVFIIMIININISIITHGGAAAALQPRARAVDARLSLELGRPGRDRGGAWI